jgi:hypothetical protein
MLVRSALLPAILIASAAAQPSQQPATIVGRISSGPPLDIADLEAKVQANPKDLDSRLLALRHYYDGPVVNPAFRDARLRHILYLVDTHPADPIAGSPMAYVYSTGGPYGDAGDHETVRNAWLRASDANPRNSTVQLNAARFIYREHPDAAEDLLRRALDRQPSDRSIAANLGFLYTMDILGLSTPGLQRLSAERDRVRAREELERTTNALVLAGAGAALPNLFMQTEASRSPNPDRTAFELSAALMAKARQLDPNDAELRGPMPLIREFQEFRQHEAGVPRPAQAPAGDAVRVAENVQAGKLIEKPEPAYPPLARQARIQGVVRFNVVIGVDGSLENITLVSGHPLLVPSALEALRLYRYLSTLLNGSPVRVITQVSVPFTLTAQP